MCTQMVIVLSVQIVALTGLFELFLSKYCKLTYKLKAWFWGAVKDGGNTHFGNNELESQILKGL